MSKQFEPTKQGLRQLRRYLDKQGKGTTVYTIRTSVDRGLGPEQRYEDWTFVRFTGLITIDWVTKEGTTAHHILAYNGTVYTEQPRGLLHAAAPAPQVAGPLGNNYRGTLDEAEIRGIEKLAAQGSDPRNRRPANSWRL